MQKVRVSGAITESAVRTSASGAEITESTDRKSASRGNGGSAEQSEEQLI